MKVKIKLHQNFCTIVREQDNEELHSIELKDNLKRALEIFKKINTLVTETGEPIYAVRTINGVSAWTFHQNSLFWEYIRHFVYFEDLVKVLYEKNYTVVADHSLDSRIKNILSLSDIAQDVSEKKYSKQLIKIAVANGILGFTAKCIGTIAIVSTLFKRKKTLVYSPDKFDVRFNCDFRLQEIYLYLRKNNVLFVEIFHTTLGRVFLKNCISRKRFALYREYLPFQVRKSKLIEKDFMCVVSGFEVHQETYIRNVLQCIDTVSKESVLWVLTLVRYIRFMKIEKLVTVDDMRSAQEIITACHMLDIPTYGFQHGHINQYHTGLMNYNIPIEYSSPFDTLFVWNTYWLEKLVTNSTMYTYKNVEVGGYIRYPKQLSLQSKQKNIPHTFSDLSVLIVNDTWASKNEVRMYIQRFVEVGATVYIGIRPDISKELQFAEFGLHPDSKVIPCIGADPEIIKKLHCVVGVYSTFLYEMMFYNLPIFAMDTSFTFGEDLVIDGLAQSLKKNFQFEDIQKYLLSFESKKDIIWPQQAVTIQSTLSDLYNHND